jgi:hypothetical protein
MPGVTSRFADLLDYARKAKVGGFLLGRMICGKKGCLGGPHASKPHELARIPRG